MRYQGKQIWEAMQPSGLLTVDELVALTVPAYRRLWQYCCEIDLMTNLACQLARFDFVWARVLDVRACLAGRRYGVDGRLVLEVADPLGLGAGRFALEGGSAGCGLPEIPSGS